MSSDRVCIFPLPEVALFPEAVLPLHVFEPRYRELTRDVLAGSLFAPQVLRVLPPFLTVEEVATACSEVRS